MRRALRALAVGLLLFLTTLALLFQWRSLPENAVPVGAGGEIGYDDFAFSVERVRRAAAVGEGATAVMPRGEVVIVTLAVHNRARRVA